jgi:alanine racemase
MVLKKMARSMTKATKDVRRPVWAEVNLSALAENFKAIQKYVNPASGVRQSPRKILCIVKGNGYGHGGPQVAVALDKAGSDWFGVTCTEEGIAVRKAGVRKPILLLTSFVPGEEAGLVKHQLTAVVHRTDQLDLLDRAARRHGQQKVSFHLKIDTGMNRLGISPTDVENFIRQFAKCGHLMLGGVFTHLASSEAFSQSLAGQQTATQGQRFFAAVDRIRALGIDPGIVHMANSGAIVARPETWADMVRPGALLYGYHPGYDPVEKRAEIEARLPLCPVMSLRAKLISIRDVPAGEGVGYGASFITQKPSKIGVLAAGYGDGIHRSLGNRGSVLLHGKAVSIVGIVSMDVTMLDVTDLPDVRVGDVATVYGVEGTTRHPANLVARSLGTVTSDLLCMVSQRVPRVYLR